MLSLMIITNMVRIITNMVTIIIILANDGNQCLVSQLDLHIMYTSFRAQPPLSSSGMSQVTLSHLTFFLIIIIIIVINNHQYHPRCQNNQSHPNQQCQWSQKYQLMVFICICTPRLPVPSLTCVATETERFGDLRLPLLLKSLLGFSFKPQRRWECRTKAQ